MKLRFWRREKKEKKLLLDFKSSKLTLGKNMNVSEDGLSIIKNKRKEEEESLSQREQDWIDIMKKQDRGMFGQEIKENQFQGTKKTGERCERTTPIGRCWQHPNKTGENKK